MHDELLMPGYRELLVAILPWLGANNASQQAIDVKGECVVVINGDG